MKKLLIFAFLAILILGIATSVHAATGSTLCVPDAAIDLKCDAGYATITDALAAAFDGDTILVGAGSHAGAELDKSVEIKGLPGAFIDSGPMHPVGLSYGFRLLTGSDGAVISHLTFSTDLAIMNGDAVNDVEIAHNTFLNSLQAVSNWGGDGWYIHHNEIIDLRTWNGGGIGILIADYTGNEANNNIVSNNKIYGTLHVDPADSGGYAGSGIVLYSDHRWGRLGGVISGNLIQRNSISLVSDTPLVVDVYAFELTQTSLVLIPGTEIFDNIIKFNDFRGTTNQLQISPAELEDYNIFNKNLGDSRGHGDHPNLAPLE